MLLSERDGMDFSATGFRGGVKADLFRLILLCQIEPIVHLNLKITMVGIIFEYHRQAGRAFRPLRATVKPSVSI